MFKSIVKSKFSTGVLLIMFILVQLTPVRVYANNLTLNIDATAELGALRTPANTMCVWDPAQYVNAEVGSKPDGWMKTAYPFLDYLVMMTFTGGRATNNWYTEDALGNPQYNFTTPVEVLQNVLRSGLKPIIVIGQVPNALSANPSDYGDSCQWGNRYPPKDWTKYYNYIKAFANQIVSSFGIDEVKTWKFRVYTEPDNTSWWVGTKEEYYKLYDYSVAALQSEIGADNLFVGPGNLMSVGNWPDMLDHFATGNNYYTGTVGTQCNSFSASHYEDAPGLGSLSSKIDTMNNMVNAHPSLGINEINIGEGGYIQDGCSPSYRLSMGQDASEAGGSWTAALFRIAQDKKFSYFANWAYYCDMFSSLPLKTPAFNVAEAIKKMYGSTRTAVSKTGLASNGNDIDAVAAVDGASNKMYVLVYNHNNTRADSTDTATLNINGIEAATGDTVNVTHWRIDHDYSNFFSTWLTDSAGYARVVRPLGDFGSSGSLYETEVPITLDTNGVAYWNARKPAYSTMDDLQRYENDFSLTVANGSVSKILTMPGHSVSLLEISNVKKKVHGPNLITNPGFEADGNFTYTPTGWSTSGNNPNANYAEANGHSGSYRLTQWSSSAYNVYTYQTKTGLVNGTYTLKAWVKNDYGGQISTYMEAKDYGGPSLRHDIPVTSIWTQISIPGIFVTSGQCTIAFYSDAPATRWILADDVEFYFEESLQTVITDELVDWSKADDHSSGLQFDTSHPQELGDGNRVCRTSTSINPAEYIVYQYQNISALNATALFSTDKEAISDFRFYTSPDGSTWTQQMGWANVDTPISSVNWTKRVYSFSNMPVGTNYIKVEFPVGGSYIYNPQLAQVQVVCN